MNREQIKDPMLFAAAEALRDYHDHLRWMSYADDELHRLRERLNLPTPTGYSQGKPNYGCEASDKARALVEEVESRMGGRFHPSDFRAVASVIDDILAEHAATTFTASDSSSPGERSAEYTPGSGPGLIPADRGHEPSEMRRKQAL